MASVQDLIQLAEHEAKVRNPGASAVSNALLGYQQAQNQGLDRFKTLIAIEEHRKQAQRMEEEDRHARAMIEQQKENSIKQGMRGVSPDGRPATRQGKLETTISTGDTGLMKVNYKIVDTSADDSNISYQKAEYVAPDGSIRIGRFNPKTGSVDMGKNDPIAPKSIADVNAQNGKMLPANTVLALNEGKNVARLLPEVESAIKENLGKFGPVTGRVRGANPYDETAQTFDAQMRAGSQSFGRFMEGGVLRKEDEEKYRKMFPQMKDDDAVKKNKLSIIRKMLAEKYEDDRKTLGSSGYDVSGFEQLEVPESIFDGGKKAGKGGGLIDVSKMSDEELRRLANGE